MPVCPEPPTIYMCLSTEEEAGEIAEDVFDDGEFGAGYHFMEMMKNERINNCLLCVTKLLGQVNLGLFLNT